MPLEIRAVVPKESIKKVEVKEKPAKPVPKPKFTKEDLYYQAIAVIKGKYVPSEEKFHSGIFVCNEGEAVASLEKPFSFWLRRNPNTLENEQVFQAWVRTVKKKDLNGNTEEFLYYRLLRTIEEYPDWIANIPQEKIKGNRVKVRGQVIFSKDSKIVVKAQQNEDAKKRFQVVLKGNLPGFRPLQFWELFGVQQDDELILESGKLIAPPPKKKFNKDNKKPYSKAKK